MLINIVLQCVNPGSHREVDEICAILGYYAARVSNSLPTFRVNLSVPSWKVKKLKWIDLWRWDRWVVSKLR